ncbi:hypothetical protein BP6252_12572 [Coleophoma cylindrospora]|uniref:Uncharacterized protein n=1 Tax=Coleophoma cylindrospora TaxID=1849047 RepID=A0A3D8QCA2_9HELO|nr:hypothetical protein BP6252_12572 [Coleophoma cylindrospora]
MSSITSWLDKIQYYPLPRHALANNEKARRAPVASPSSSCPRDGRDPVQIGAP